MFVSTMFVILCVSLYLRDGGMQIRFMNAGVSRRNSRLKHPRDSRSTNRPLRECVTLQPL
jgi:hypothetical protein